MSLEMDDKNTVLTRNWMAVPDRPPKWEHLIFPPPRPSKSYKQASQQWCCDSASIRHLSDSGAGSYKQASQQWCCDSANIWHLSDSGAGTAAVLMERSFSVNRQVLSLPASSVWESSPQMHQRASSSPHLPQLQISATAKMMYIHDILNVPSDF